MNYSLRTALLTFAALLVVIIPVSVSAGPVIRSGESVSVEQDQTVSGDLYGAGGDVSISGKIQGDAYVTGGSVTINAPIDADLSALGGTTQIHGPIGDDVRVVGGEIKIADSVEGDVMVFGGVLRILSTATIKGDVIFFGGELVVEGPVGGNIFGVAESTRIDSKIGGNVDIHSEQGLAIGDRAEILGHIVYKGKPDIVRSQNAVVVGNIQHDEPEIEKVSLQMILIPVISVLFAALVLFLVFRRRIESLVIDTQTSYGVQGLIGLAALLVFPFVATVLIVSVLGILIGIIVLALYIALLIATWIIAGMVLGALLMKFVTKKAKVSMFSVTVGVALLQVCVFIPFIGPLVALALFLIVLGGIVRNAYRAIVR